MEFYFTGSRTGLLGLGASHPTGDFSTGGGISILERGSVKNVKNVIEFDIHPRPGVEIFRLGDIKTLMVGGPENSHFGNPLPQKISVL